MNVELNSHENDEWVVDYDIDEGTYRVAYIF